jgi:hypothetical protein
MSSVASEEQGEFFGLKPANARTSIHIICSLHRDLDPILGETPASLQAALGALDQLDITKDPNEPKYANEHHRRAEERKNSFEKSYEKKPEKMIRKVCTNVYTH